MKSQIRSFSSTSQRAERLKSTQTQADTTKVSTNVEDQLTILSSNKLHHKCPAMDQATLTLLQTHLRPTIKTILKKESPSLLSLKKEDPIKFFIVLTSEFVKHNKSWINPNSMASVNSLTKALDNSGYNIQSQELVDVLRLTSQIVSTLRKEFKQKKNYP